MDGSIATADVLVGADGIGSRTRRAMYSDMASRVRDVDPKQATELEDLRNKLKVAEEDRRREVRKFFWSIRN